MNWYEQDVERLEKEATNIKYKPQMVFYGSSSITGWKSLYDDFAGYKPINLGFGGSTLEACVYYFNRIMQPYEPRYMVVYAGDNDLGDGKKPDVVFSYFEQLCNLVIKSFGDIAVYYISIKPSIARWDLNKQIIRTNELISNSIESRYPQMHFVNIYNLMLNKEGKPDVDLYINDGLHLSSKGYALWKEVLLTQFSLNIHIE